MTAITPSPCDVSLSNTTAPLSSLPLIAPIVDMWQFNRQLRALRRQQRDCGCEFTDSAQLYPQERQSLILSGGFIPLAR